MTTGWPYDAAPDPAPGDPDQVRAVARSTGRTARQLSAGAAALRRVAADDALWTGEAATAFRSRLGALPRDLDRAAAALAEVELALDRCATVLDDAQARARSLAAAWSAATSGGTGDLAAWFVRVDDVAADVAAASLRAQEAVRRAAAAAPRQPGWLEQMARRVDVEVGRFVREHARAITLALDVLTLLSMPLAIGALAPAAGLLVAVSLGGTLLLRHYGEASNTDVVLAVAGTVVGPAAAAVMSARVVTATAAVAPAAARASVTAAVRTAQPVASTVLRTTDRALTVQGDITALQDLAGAAGAAWGRREEDGRRPRDGAVPATPVQPVPAVP